MPSSSARLKRYSSPSRERARGGVRVTKLCWSSEGGWREVREVGMGNTGVTVTGDECCVGSDNGLEILLIPEELLASSGKIMGVWIRRHGVGEKISDEGLKTQSKTEPAI